MFRVRPTGGETARKLVLAQLPFRPNGFVTSTFLDADLLARYV